MRDLTINALKKMDGRIYLANAGKDYPNTTYFHPSEHYPEYPFYANTEFSETANRIYSGVRRLFSDMELDQNNFDTPHWNPLGNFVGAGDSVVIKPNWVSHFVHGGASNSENILECLVTHTALIRAVVDYAFLAVGSTGKIILADSPIQGTDFKLMLKRISIAPLLSFYKLCSVPVKVVDLRKVHTKIAEDGRIVEHVSLVGDPKGYTIVKVDERSILTSLDGDGDSRYRVYDYDAREMRKAHGDGMHRYLIANTVLDADFVINLPKLKTHIKTGMTSALKNFVGVNGDKSFLPHFRAGSPEENGDDYPKKNTFRLVKNEYRYIIAHWPRWIRNIVRAIGNFLLKSTERSDEQFGNIDPYFLSGGSWHGNDTAWRMVVDLNTALMYSDNTGNMREQIQRRWLTIVDAVVVGEGNGPLSPEPRQLGYLIAGANPVEIDYVCARLLGFNWQKIKFIKYGYPKLFGKEDFNSIQIYKDKVLVKSVDDNSLQNVKTPSGWTGNIELQKENREIDK